MLKLNVSVDPYRLKGRHRRDAFRDDSRDSQAYREIVFVSHLAMVAFASSNCN